LLDGQTRQLLGLVPYDGLSPLRVGASAGVATRYLAPRESREVAILGSSKQARRQLQAILRTAPNVEKVRVFSPTQEHRQAFAKEMSEWMGVSVEPVDNAEAAVTGADIVDSAAAARSNTFEWGWVKPGALVMAIGGGQMPAEVLTEARVVLPSWDSTADESTQREPFGSAIRAGTYTKDDILGELGAVILGEVTARENPGQTVVFDVGRLNMWAVAVSNWAYEWARVRELGTQVSLSLS
jgi:alanine dehydrogenase